MAIRALAIFGIVCLMVGLVEAAKVEAHLPSGVKCSDESTNAGPSNGEAECDHVAEVVHARFKSRARAHRILAVGGCESGTDKWADNGQYLGIWQVSENLRRLHHWARNVKAQVRVVWEIMKEDGLGPWKMGRCA